MSFTAYASAIAGSILTAAFWNAQVKNNGLIVKTSIDDNGHLIDGTIVTKTANYPIIATDDVVLCNGTFTVTLLTAVGRAGKAFKVKQVGTGTVTMASTSAQTIDGAAAGSTLVLPNDSYTFESDGANWIVV